MNTIRNPHLVLRLHRPARTERPANRVPDESSAGGEAGRKEVTDEWDDVLAYVEATTAHLENSDG